MIAIRVLDPDQPIPLPLRAFRREEALHAVVGVEDEPVAVPAQDPAPGPEHLTDLWRLGEIDRDPFIVQDPRVPPANFNRPAERMRPAMAKAGVDKTRLEAVASPSMGRATSTLLAG